MMLQNYQGGQYLALNAKIDDVSSSCCVHIFWCPIYNMGLIILRNVFCHPAFGC